MPNAISVEHVSKVYRLGTIGTATLGEDLARWWARTRGKSDPSLKVGQHHARHEGEDFWALDDVSFSANQGEVLGVIGGNGAGKSTLLKILSQVTAPTAGQITIRGRVASLLEVGTGFHPELTGRENVFLNGAILGMTKTEIRRSFDEIVAFSECEEFIDTPVKRYSSGMYVRLAFAVAAHLEPEVLIVDEVLAVGDAQFQRKCLGKMRDVSAHGRTVFFVSHSMAAVGTLCSRVILLRNGRIALDGRPTEVIAEYQSGGGVQDGEMARVLDGVSRSGSARGQFASIRVTPVDSERTPLRVAVPGCDLVIETDVQCHSDFADANVAVIIFDAAGYRVIDINTFLRNDSLSLTSGQRARVVFHARDTLLKPGRYYVGLWLGTTLEPFDYIENALVYDVHQDMSAPPTRQAFPGVYQCRFTHHMQVSETSQPDGDDAQLALRTSR